MNEIREAVLSFDGQNYEALALATLVQTTGSSYRRSGARMLANARRQVAGSLSAGCLEDEVAGIAREVLATGEARLVRFDTRRRFGCHGSIEVLVERAGHDLLGKLAEEMKERRSFMVATVFKGDNELLGTRVVASDFSASADTFVQEVEPPTRLLIIGGGPDAIALVSQARLLGWDVSAMESITEFDALVDPWTVAVIATHNYGKDCAALRHLAPLGLPYLGVIGPRRRRDEMLSDVLDSGAALESELFAPAGLHLSAETPSEIALSVVAEIQAVLTKASGISLRERHAPIHEPQASARVAA